MTDTFDGFAGALYRRACARAYVLYRRTRSCSYVSYGRSCALTDFTYSMARARAYILHS